jgi:hypothetical protein
MTYHFGPERRKGGDRRETRYPAFAGIERRLDERRHQRKKEREGPFSGIIVALIAFVLVDTAAWHGYYRHAIYRGIDDQADSVRQWSANVWNFQSTR